jgi:long-chain acyl-CoA synthetase
MNYTSDDQPNPCGEICIRGPIIFQGYYKDEVQTREVIDEEGWLHTGDIGTWIAGGRLKIIDRKRIIFKLAQGEYIAPEKIENVYVKCNFVAQCFIYGGNFNSSLVVVVSVDPDVMKAWAASQGIVHNDLTQLCNNPKQSPFVHLQQSLTESHSISKSCMHDNLKRKWIMKQSPRSH